MNKKIWYIQQLDLFKGLNTKEVRELESCLDMKQYSKKETIYEPGDKDKVYIVKTGQVTLYQLNSNGKKIIIDILKSGSIFGDLGSVTSSETFVESKNESLVCFLDKNIFFSLVSKSPELSERLMKNLFNRLVLSEYKVSSLASDSALNRFIKLMLNLGIKNLEGVEVLEKFTHEELSQMLGISRQTVTTIINQLEKEGTLTRSGKNIKFKRQDLEKLTN